MCKTFARVDHDDGGDGVVISDVGGQRSETVSIQGDFSVIFGFERALLHYYRGDGGNSVEGGIYVPVFSSGGGR